MNVLICGMPKSGHHVLHYLCDVAGVPWVVWHGAAGDTTAEITWDDLDDLRALVPVRDPWVQRMAWKGRGVADSAEEAHWRAIFREVSYRRVPTRIVPYRSIVDNPIETGNDIREWLGFPRLGSVAAIWGREIYDGDLKYQAQRGSTP